MPDGPRLGRTRDQRWSQTSTCDGSADRLERILHAEFRVLHEELASLKEKVEARPEVPKPQGRDNRQPARRGLGRGLDALLTPSPRPWWNDGIFPDPLRSEASPEYPGK